MLLTGSFDRSLVKNHRFLKDIIFQTSSLLDDAERELEAQIDDINALINRIGNVEPAEGPSRYDNLDSVLTIAKGPVDQTPITPRTACVPQADRWRLAAQRSIR